LEYRAGYLAKVWIPDSFADLSAGAARASRVGNGFGPPRQTRSLDIVVTRGALVESRHRVHAAVVGADGTLVDAARDPELTVWWRSCAKPFQVMPLLRSGGFDEFGWGVEELALACASHGGEPEHVAIAGRMLARLGLEEGDLACGPHEPLASRGIRLARETGQRLTRLHNNCSGKHAAMLARTVQIGAPTVGYERPAHAVQRDCLQATAEWCGLPTESVGVGVDGCGVSVFALPLANMALSYARLVRAAAEGDAASRRVVSAMTTHPFLVGGTDRFDTVLMQACGGNVVCKIGAEGVHTFAIVDRGLGFALKVEDGAPRAQYPAVLALLAAYDALPSPLPDPLREYVQRGVRNTRGEIVGVIRAADADVGDRVEVAE
jgi:L-asparaginase II